jgi:hypothetical protein
MTLRAGDPRHPRYERGRAVFAECACHNEPVPFALRDTPRLPARPAPPYADGSTEPIRALSDSAVAVARGHVAPRGDSAAPDNQSSAGRRAGRRASRSGHAPCCNRASPQVVRTLRPATGPQRPMTSARDSAFIGYNTAVVTGRREGANRATERTSKRKIPPLPRRGRGRGDKRNSAWLKALPRQPPKRRKKRRRV